MRPGADARRSSSPTGRCGSADTLSPVVEWPPTVYLPAVRSGSRAGARTGSAHLTPARSSAALRFVATVRCGAFADERRVVTATRAAYKTREVKSRVRAG